MVSKLGAKRDRKAVRESVNLRKSKGYSRTLALICAGMDTYDAINLWRSAYQDKKVTEKSWLNKVVGDLLYAKYIYSESLQRKNSRKALQPNWIKITEEFISYLQDQLRKSITHDYKRSAKARKNMDQIDGRLKGYSPKLTALFMKAYNLSREDAVKFSEGAIQKFEKFSDVENRLEVDPIIFGKEFLMGLDMPIYKETIRSEMIDEIDWDRLRPDLKELMKFYFRLCHPDIIWQSTFLDHFKILEKELIYSGLENVDPREDQTINPMSVLGLMLAWDRPAARAMIALTYTKTKKIPKLRRRKNGKTEKK